MQKTDRTTEVFDTKSYPTFTQLKQTAIGIILTIIAIVMFLGIENHYAFSWIPLAPASLFDNTNGQLIWDTTDISCETSNCYAFTLKEQHWKAINSKPKTHEQDHQSPNKHYSIEGSTDGILEDHKLNQRYQLKLDNGGQFIGWSSNSQFAFFKVLYKPPYNGIPEQDTYLLCVYDAKEKKAYRLIPKAIPIREIYYSPN